MSDSVRPLRRQPTRLPRPWDSLGKNTGVGCHFLLQCVKVKSEVAQSCPTLSDPMDCSPPGSSILGIFQARVLEWDVIAFSKKEAESCLIGFLWPTSSQSIVVRGVCVCVCVCVCVQSLSCVWFFATLWTVARQALLSMGFPRQEYWNGGHFLLQRIVLTQGSNMHLLHLHSRWILYCCTIRDVPIIGTVLHKFVEWRNAACSSYNCV